MTEKRFVYIEHKGADYILDTPNWELDFIEMLGDTLEAEEIVDLLNEQYETIQSFKIENDELKREVNLLTEFFRKNNFSLDDFNGWLTKERWGWEAKEAWSERFGDLND